VRYLPRARLLRRLARAWRGADLGRICSRRHRRRGCAATPATASSPARWGDGTWSGI